MHVEAGCHTWATGKLQPPAMSVRLKRGGRLHIVNQDVDAHRLVQIAGPKVGRDMVMMMNHRMQIAFPKAGVYRFKTVVVEMPGMTEVETKGPDHNLFLTVKVT